MMALLGSNISSEVGLRLLLSPLGSNIVVRTACCSVGIALPVYSTFKAIEQKDQMEQQRWLLYWAAYGSFSIAEVFTDKLISWFPLYYHMKFAFLVWLQLPSVNGARFLYTRHLRPFLLRHQARLDQIVGFIYSEMGNFVTAHQEEIQYARRLLSKLLASANHVVKELVHPTPRRANGVIEGSREHELVQPTPRRVDGVIEGPREHVQNAESESED